MIKWIYHFDRRFRGGCVPSHLYFPGSCCSRLIFSFSDIFLGRHQFLKIKIVTTTLHPLAQLPPLHLTRYPRTPST